MSLMMHHHAFHQITGAMARFMGGDAAPAEKLLTWAKELRRVAEEMEGEAGKQ